MASADPQEENGVHCWETPPGASLDTGHADFHAGESQITPRHELIWINMPQLQAASTPRQLLHTIQTATNPGPSMTGFASPSVCDGTMHLEVSYLMDSLQQQQVEIAALAIKIPILEDKLLQDELSYVRRKVKKQLGWLKYRLRQAGQQEQMIAERLGQITYEIQSRDAFDKIVHERQYENMQQQQQQQQQQLLHHQPISTCQVGLQRLCLNSQHHGWTSSHDHASPDQWPIWQPQHFDENVIDNGLSSSTETWQYAETSGTTFPFPGVIVLPPKEDQGSDYMVVGDDGLLRPTVVRRCASLNDAELKIFRTKAVHEVESVKRHSFPRRSIDIGSAKAQDHAEENDLAEEEKEGEYVGYYIKR